MADDGYTIKTDDGSLLGPMKLEAVEGFFKQGLVKHDNLVRRPGSYNWVPLSEILAKDLKSEAAAKPNKRAAAPAPAPMKARPRPQAARPESDQRPRAANGSGGGALKAVVRVLVVAVVGAGGFLAHQVLRQPAPVATPTPDPDVAQRLRREQRQKAIEAVALETPQFSPATIDMLMIGSGTEAPQPAEVFRRGQLAVSHGISQLSPVESRELRALMQAVYAPLPAKDRARLGAYLERLKAKAVTTPDEDRAVALLMKTGAGKLSKERLARLQAILEKAAREGSSVL